VVGNGRSDARNYNEGGIALEVNVEEVRRIAALAKLALSHEEEERLAGELTEILHYVEKLSEVDLDDVPATTHPVARATAFREDEPHVSWKLESALRNAPQQRDGHVVVPKIIVTS